MDEDDNRNRKVTVYVNKDARRDFDDVEEDEYKQIKGSANISNQMHRHTYR